MTHNDIYIKFLIEYDKANVTSSYPALTEYEIATLLDRAYLLLIARKLTGNNTRRAPFEYDTKAIEDLRPLVKTDIFKYVSTGDTATNELKYKLPENMLYYLLGVVKYSNNMYDRELLTTIDHRSADNFKATNSNMPWIKKPVAYLEEDNLHVLLDPYKYFSSSKLKVTARPLMTGTYIITPAKFAIGVPPEEENNENDSNNGGNNNNGNNGNNDGGNGENEVYYWEIHDEFIPSTINNSDNKASFQLYAQKNLEKSECFVLIISGSNCISIQPKGNYTFDISVISTGNVLIKITCSKDNSINSTKQVYVVYNAPQNPDEGDNGGGNNNGGNSGGNENPTGINYIDLGLPSGTKWADRNLGASSDKERGGYYLWGDPTGTRKSYTDGSTILTLLNSGMNGRISLQTADYSKYDIVHQKYGRNCHTPTIALMQELALNCDWLYTENYKGVQGLNGYVVTGRGSYVTSNIFIPRNGYKYYQDGSMVLSPNSDGHCLYWSCEAGDPYDENNPSDAWYKPYLVEMAPKSSCRASKTEDWYACNIRPVQVNSSSQGNEDTPTTVVTDEGQNVRMVDLGFSFLWADRNIGAASPNDKGEYISWGETHGKDNYQSSNYRYFENDIDEEKNVSIVRNDFYLKPEYDAATLRWGTKFLMPTTEAIDDLLTRCEATWEWRTDSKGQQVGGMKFTSEVNGNSIFLPAGGYTYHDNYGNLTYYGDNYRGEYYSNTKRLREDKTRVLGILFNEPKEYLDCSTFTRFIGRLIRPVSPK